MKNRMTLEERLKELDDAFEAYEKATEGLTYADVDEAKRRTRLALWHLSPYVNEADRFELCAMKTSYFEHVRSYVRWGQRWSNMTFFAFLGSLIGPSLGVLATGRVQLGSVLAAVPFGLLHLFVRWTHERGLRRKI